MGRGGKYPSLALFKERKEIINRIGRTFGVGPGTMPYGDYIGATVSLKLLSWKLKFIPVSCSNSTS